MLRRVRRASVILFAVLVSTWQYVSILLLTGRFESNALMVTHVADGIGGAPFVYRVLTPLLLDAAGNTMAVHVAWFAACMGVFYVAIWAWACRWKAMPANTVMLIALVFIVMSDTLIYGMSSYLEWSLLVCGLLILSTHKLTRWHRVSFAVLLVIGTLNRETTGLLLGLSWLAAYPNSWNLISS